MSEQNYRVYSHAETLPAWIPHTAQGADPCDPTVLKWSGGEIGLPRVGDMVALREEWGGAGRVVAYFVEYGWLGVLVLPKKWPRWFNEQNGKTPIHLFGAEILGFRAAKKAA